MIVGTHSWKILLLWVFRDDYGLSLCAEERDQRGSLEGQGRRVSASPPYLHREPEMLSRTLQGGVFSESLRKFFLYVVVT